MMLLLSGVIFAVDTATAASATTIITTLGQVFSFSLIPAVSYLVVEIIKARSKARQEELAAEDRTHIKEVVTSTKAEACKAKGMLEKVAQQTNGQTERLLAQLQQVASEKQALQDMNARLERIIADQARTRT